MSNESGDSEMPYDNCVDCVTPLCIPLCAKYKRSFGYVTIKDRLPVILTQIVDHLSRDRDKIVKDYGKDSLEGLKVVIGKISKLKNELQTNKPLEPLESNASDIALWNTFFKQQTEIDGDVPHWFDTPWLYAECYMYRKTREMFEMTEFLNSFDPFRDKKQVALYNSLETINILAEHVSKILQSKNSSNIESEFLKLLYVDLWGNRCDLSLSAGGEIVMEEDPLLKLSDLNEFILVDKANKIWETLAANVGNSDIILDIVMDNAGYELFTDLCLADFIITFSLAAEVRFRVKNMPWYVSDTNIPDFHWTLQTLSKSENPVVSALADRWSGYVDSGKWTLHADEFWTLPHVFSQMQSVDSKLYKDLSRAVLIIFKGDLNYRKLTGDINWDPTTPFSDSLRGFQPTNVATLRTLKADVICGLSEGQAREVEAKSSDWLVSGQYAVIQFSPKEL